MRNSYFLSLLLLRTAPLIAHFIRCERLSCVPFLSDRVLKPGQTGGSNGDEQGGGDDELRNGAEQRRQCRCDSCRGHHFGLQALK